MLLLCGGKPACSLRGMECFPVTLGRRLTKFQGPDLLAHLEWFSCTCRNLSEVLRGGVLDTGLKGRQQSKPCFWRPGGGEAFVFSGQRPSLLKLFPPPEQAFPTAASRTAWPTTGEDSSFLGCLGQPDPVPLCVPGRLHLDCDPDSELCAQNGVFMTEPVKEGTVQSEQIMEKSL